MPGRRAEASAQLAGIFGEVCGIVGYVGVKDARRLLFDGLRRLEYRGYDSAGISVLADGEIESVRAVGNLDALEQKLVGTALQPVDCSGADTGRSTAQIETASTKESSPAAVALACAAPGTGIGHTRWATHGRVIERNAHPHSNCAGNVHVVVNGIIENYLELKQQLGERGCEFSSDTDAEVVAHLIAHHLDGDLEAAVRSADAEMEGRYAFVAMSAQEPQTLAAVRWETPLVIGRGEGEQFVGSAVPAFLSQTREVQRLEDGDIAVLRPDGVSITDSAGSIVQRPVESVDWDQDTAEKGGFETFMLKEIHEQADAVAETIADRLTRDGRVSLAEESLDECLLDGVRRIVIVACGTSYHAGLIGRYAIEQWARMPVEMDIASEYRYREPVISGEDLVIGISQSGETADTLAAMRMARGAGARVLAITNVMGSQATREADGVLFTRAGLEIGVAATKTFVCQVAAMYLLALRLAEMRGTLAVQRLSELVDEVRQLPHLIAEITGSPDPGQDEGIATRVAEIADRFAERQFFLYMGRNVGLPVALEGALKLKEISYIATDAYAAGEMKHGPIALLDESTPVVCIATDSPVLEKLASNMQEVRARGATVIAVVSAGNETIESHLDVAIEVPALDWMLQPILAVIPLQMLAYHIARRRGLNVDQPRNLAKTVTVE
jgi:glutamine---fructose-6-phosphate transaminase (isomerizing)